MLIETFKAHPLLKQLYASDLPTNSNYVLGLYRDRLNVSKNKQPYVIGTKELVDVFKDRCSAGDEAAIQLLLAFDYNQLINLPAAHPFHLESNPFANIQFLLKEIREANYYGKKSISLCIQKYIETWLNTQLESKESIFSDEVSKAVHAVAAYQPHLAYKRLQSTLTAEFKLTYTLYKNENYSRILSALEAIASYSEYFEFAARKLLILAAREVELGVNHAHYKAIDHLINLFRNACTRTEVSLEQRKKYLEILVNEAHSRQDYYQLFVLMKVLGTAANVFESEEDGYIQDPYFDQYIHFAIEVLMRYAGINDEDQLCLTAEEELHTLLEETTDEPEIWGASDVPFFILRFFLESKRKWKINPFDHLSELEKFIEFCKEENSDGGEWVKPLERRLQQLISLIADREFISEDFILYLSSKSPEKMCEIGVDYQADSQLNLHERQSLAERLIFSGTTNLHDIEREWPKCTYVVANFGMIISNIPHNPISKHKRLFRTIPIKIPKYIITGRTHQSDGHAEEALYDYLLKEDHIADLLSEFKKQFGIQIGNHKVYGVVLDLHGTYDMCLSCSNKGLEFQDQFRQRLLETLPQQQLKTIKKTPNQLPIVIRYSSDLSYHYFRASDDKKQGIRTLVSKEGEKRDLSMVHDAKEEYPTSEYLSKKDIRYYGANLLVHGKSNWHSFWSQPKRNEFKNKSLTLESWTAFTTDRQINSMDEQRKQTDYTQSGAVETEREFEPDNLGL